MAVSGARAVSELRCDVRMVAIVWRVGDLAQEGGLEVLVETPCGVMPSETWPRLGIAGRTCVVERSDLDRPNTELAQEHAKSAAR